MKEKKKIKFRFPLWAKTLAVLMLSVSLVSVVAVVYSSNHLRNITRSHYINHSIEVADSLGLYLNLDDVKEVKNKVDTIYQLIPEAERVNNTHWGEPEWDTYLAKYNEVVEMPAYSRIMDQLVKFHTVNDAKFTSLGYADFVNNRLVYLVDDTEIEERCLPGSFDEFTKHDYSIYDDMNKGFTPEISKTPEYGYLVSTGRPIFDPATNEIVAFALVDLSMDAIVAKENEGTNTLTIILISLSVAAVLVGFSLVLLLIIRPVRKLTRVANEYVEGNNTELNKFAQISINTSDEIEDLSNSMKKMENDINHYIDDLLSTTTKLKGAEKQVDEMKYLVDKDALTGMSNKRAYFEAEERLNEEIRLGKAKFAISMIDLNDLKFTNDTLGHEKGDALIIALSKMIKEIFTNSIVYRIGGDEFVVISENNDFKEINELENKFKQAIEDSINGKSKKNSAVSAAIGVAIFDASTDNNVEDAFKRADRKMYENKKRMKEMK